MKINEIDLMCEMEDEMRNFEASIQRTATGLGAMGWPIVSIVEHFNGHILFNHFYLWWTYSN
jgi:hypothetical protein